MICWEYQGQFRSYGPPLFFVGVALVAISSICVDLLGAYAYRVHRLATGGVPATGTIIRKIMHRAGDRGYPETTYALDYVFTTAAGHQFAVIDTVDPATWDQVTEGGRLEVEYAASQPQIHQIGTAAQPYVGAALATAVASLVALAGAALAVKGLLMTKSARARARASGSGKMLVDTPDPILMKVLAFLLRWVNPANVAAVVMLFMGAIFLLVGASGVHRERLLRSEGKMAIGVVLAKRILTTQGQRNSAQYP